MKWSKYNTIFQYNDCWLLYNSASNTFAEMDEELYDIVTTIKESPDFFSFSPEYEELHHQLLDCLVLVENDEDIFNSIKFKTHKNRFQTDTLNLTILPTLDCNFRCLYCFEENHEHSYMTLEVMNAIVAYIKQFPTTKMISIAWMGGEPLLGMDTITYLTKKIKELNITLNASIVTNGYLLDESTITQLIDLEVKSIQITIDGPKEKHDKRRILVNKETTFDKIINNVKLILKNKDKISLSIRVNIDRKNQEDFNELYHYLLNELGDDIFIYPGFIEESPYGCSKNLCAMKREEKVSFYLNKLPRKKHLPFFYPSDNMGECVTARNINSFVIGPKGELYKCWECIGREEMIVGNILNNGIITNNKLQLYFLTGADFLESAKCRNCTILPICYGGCPIRRVDKEYHGKNIDSCSVFKGNLPQFLTLHYRIKQQ